MDNEKPKKKQPMQNILALYLIVSKFNGVLNIDSFEIQPNEA